MKMFALLLCALGLLAVPACKRNEESACSTCHEKRERKPSCHTCKEKHCSFFGRCVDGEESEEHHRYDEEVEHGK